MEAWTLPRITMSDGAVEALKWLGLLAMTADHAHKYGMVPAVPGLFEAGRLALPLFGFVLAYKLSRPQSNNLEVYRRVLGRVAVSGAVASIPFMALGGLGFGWWPLNVMGTLAVAVSVMYLIHQRGAYWKLKTTAVFLLGGSFIEFWWPGVALCVAAWRYCIQPSVTSILCWVGATASLTIINGNWWACAAFAVIAAAASITINIPRLSRFFYIYYPAHLAALLLLGFKIEETP